METMEIVWQANTYKLDHIGMNPSAESYLVLHRFGVSIVLRCLFALPLYNDTSSCCSSLHRLL